MSGLQYSTLVPQKPKRLQQKPVAHDRPRPLGPQSVTAEAVAVAVGVGTALDDEELEGVGVLAAVDVEVVDAERDALLDGLLDGLLLHVGAVAQLPYPS